MDIDYSLVYLFITIAVITVIVIGLIILIPLAIIRRHFDFIKSHPVAFTIETILVGLLPALPLLAFIQTRGVDSSMAYKLFYGLIVKFAAFHVLLEISGYYKHEFGSK